MQNRFMFRFVQNINDKVLSSEFYLFTILTLYCFQVAYFYTRVVALQLLTFTVNVCCLIIGMLRCFLICFFYTCDSILEVSDKFLYFSYKYNLTFPCFCKYLLFKTENMGVFIFFKFSDEGIILVVL